MKHLLLLLVVVVLSICKLQSQDLEDKWTWHLSVGHYPASIANPAVQPFRAGMLAGIGFKWNNHYRHQFVQSLNLGYFFHKHIQGAVQFFTEAGYQLNLKYGLSIRPLMLGGGYVLSLVNQTSLKWNETNSQYEEVNVPVRHNWMGLAGPSISWRPRVRLLGRPIALTLDYRIQIQGIFIQQTAPVIAYAPIRIGIALPFSRIAFKNPPPDIRVNDI